MTDTPTAQLDTIPEAPRMEACAICNVTALVGKPHICKFRRSVTI